MIFSIALLTIGILVLFGGIYYFVKEKADAESRKIYGIISGAGGVAAVMGAIKLLFELLA